MLVGKKMKKEQLKRQTRQTNPKGSTKRILRLRKRKIPNCLYSHTPTNKTSKGINHKDPKEESPSPLQ